LIWVFEVDYKCIWVFGVDYGRIWVFEISRKGNMSVFECLECLEWNVGWFECFGLIGVDLSIWNIPKRKYDRFECLEYPKKEIWLITGCFEPYVLIWVFGVIRMDYRLIWVFGVFIQVYLSVFKCLEYSKKGLWLIWVFGVAYVLIWVFEVDSECLEYLIGVDWCWLLLIWVFGTFQKQFMSDVTVLKIHWLFWIWYDRYIQVFSDSHTPRVAGVCVRVRVSASVSA
jgi:hypothetical protein